MIKTFILIVFGELIFRATRFKAALVMIKRIFTKFSFKGFTVLNLKRLGLPIEASLTETEFNKIIGD